MACAKPVITTSIAAEGLNLTSGHEGIIEDTVRGFAEQVVRLLADPDLARKLGANARNRVEKDYDWKLITRNLLTLYAGMCAHEEPEALLEAA
jgi:glycosyltransferase involved in cell wall biosynthesis